MAYYVQDKTAFNFSTLLLLNYSYIVRRTNRLHEACLLYRYRVTTDGACLLTQHLLLTELFNLQLYRTVAIQLTSPLILIYATGIKQNAIQFLFLLLLKSVSIFLLQ